MVQGRFYQLALTVCETFFEVNFIEPPCNLLLTYLVFSV